MSETIQCPSCAKRYAVKADLRGKRVKCKSCGHSFEVLGPAKTGAESVPTAEFAEDVPVARLAEEVPVAPLAEEAPVAPFAEEVPYAPLASDPFDSPLAASAGDPLQPVARKRPGYGGKKWGDSVGRGAGSAMSSMGTSLWQFAAANPLFFAVLAAAVVLLLFCRYTGTPTAGLIAFGGGVLLAVLDFVLVRTAPDSATVRGSIAPTAGGAFFIGITILKTLSRAIRNSPEGSGQVYTALAIPVGLALLGVVIFAAVKLRRTVVRVGAWVFIAASVGWPAISLLSGGSGVSSIASGPESGDPTGTGASGTLPSAPVPGLADSVRKPPFDGPKVAWELPPDGVASATSAFSAEPIMLSSGQVEDVAFSDPQAGRAVAMLSKFVRTTAGQNPPPGDQWLEYCDLFEGKSLDTVVMRDGSRLLAISPSGKSAAVLPNTWGLEVWSLDDGQRTSELKRPGDTCWAAFVDEDLLLTLAQSKGVLTLWRLSDGEKEWTTELGKEGWALLSPGRKYVGVLWADRCCFLDSRSGKLVGDLPLPVGVRVSFARKGVLRSSSGAKVWTPTGAFSRDGTRLAVGLETPHGMVAVAWDLTAGTVEAIPYKRPPIHNTIKNCPSVVRWAGARHLFAGDKNKLWLIDLDRKTVVWRYLFAEGDWLNTGPDDRQWVAVSRAGAVRLAGVACDPRAEALRVKAAMPANSRPLLEPGMPVRIDVRQVSVGDQAVIQGHLERAIVAAGLTIGNAGPRFVASSSRVQGEGYEFGQLDRFGLPVPGGEVFTIMAYQRNASIVLMDTRQQLVWGTTDTFFARQPSFVTIPEGQNPANFLSKQTEKGEAAEVEAFFARVNLPGLAYPEITDSKGQPGLGETALNVPRGPQPPSESVAVKPPEREVVRPGVSIRPTEQHWSGTKIPKPPEDQAAWEESSLAYTRQTYVDLIAGEDAALRERMRWLPGGKRPSVGVRWGMGIQSSSGAIPDTVDASDDLAEYTGPAVPAIGKEVNQRLADGVFGDWPAPGEARLREVDFLGIASQARLIAAAGQRGLDAIAVANLSRRAIGLTGRADIRLTVRLIDVPQNKILWTSKMLSSSQVVAAQDEGEDLVGELVEQVMAQIDENFALVDMPALKPEHVKKRLEGLAAELSGSDSPDKLLPILSELRYYVVAGLLAPEEATPMCEKILGRGKGAAVISGSSADRRAVLEAWLEE